MKTSDLFALPHAEQKKWLESLNVHFDEDLICYILTFDESALEEWLEYPEDYETGLQLRNVFPKLTPDRESEIKHGAKLSDLEIEHLKEAVWIHQIDNDDGLSGVNYMGHSVSCEDGDAYALFSGFSEGPGTSWSFDRIYQSQEAAIMGLKDNLEENERYCPI